jgi:hypothetical protein
MSDGVSIGARTLRVIVSALFLLAFLMLLSSPPTRAQDRTPTPSAQELWKKYPLDPTPTPGGERSASSTPTDSNSAARPRDRAPARSEGALPIVLLACGFVAFGAALGLMWVRRRGAVTRQIAAAPPASRLGNGSHTRSASDPTAPTPENGLQPSHAAAARGPNGHASGRDSDVSSSAAVVPPEPQGKWIATIGWRHTDADSRFCVSARAAEGGPATVVAESDPLQWPPASPTAVRALTRAVAKLEASLVAAGWKALPPEREWYAKRFAWEPAPEEQTVPRPASSRFARHTPSPEDTAERQLP